MKRIGVDQVARALVRLGIVLVTISVIVMVLQATPLLARTTGITCTPMVSPSVNMTVLGVDSIQIHPSDVVIGAPSQMVGDFLGARNSFILSHQPDRSYRLARIADFPASTGESSATALGFGAFRNLPVSVFLQGKTLA